MANGKMLMADTCLDQISKLVCASRASSAKRGECVHLARQGRSRRAVARQCVNRAILGPAARVPTHLQRIAAKPVNLRVHTALPAQMGSTKISLDRLIVKLVQQASHAN